MYSFAGGFSIILTVFVLSAPSIVIAYRFITRGNRRSDRELFALIFTGVLLFWISVAALETGSVTPVGTTCTANQTVINTSVTATTQSCFTTYSFNPSSTLFMIPVIIYAFLLLVMTLSYLVRVIMNL